jgi:hypothetical protein
LLKLAVLQDKRKIRLEKIILVKHSEGYIMRTFFQVRAKEPSDWSKEATLVQGLYNLYLATLDLQDIKEVNIFPELEEFATKLYEKLNADTSLIKTTLEYKPFKRYKRDKDLTIFLYTGGKDSFASYQKYKKDTKRTKLFFVRGVNPLYPLEAMVLPEHEKLLCKKIDVVELKAPKLKNQTESSVKNILIHALAIEYYKVIPKKISFGFIRGDSNLLEEEELDKGTKLLISQMEVEGTLEVEGSSQTGLVVGDSKAIMFYGLKLLYELLGVESTNGISNLVETYKIVRKKKAERILSSCMSLTAFRDYNCRIAKSKYVKTFGEVDVLAGTVKVKISKSVKKISIMDLKQYDIKEIYNYSTKEWEPFFEVEVDENHIKNIDNFGIYECSVCDKCVERYLVQSNHFKVKYSQEFIDRCYKILIRKLDKMCNTNGVSYYNWLVDDLGLTKEVQNRLIEKRIISKKQLYRVLDVQT